MSTHFIVSTFYYPLSKILSFSSYTSTEVTAYHKKKQHNFMQWHYQLGSFTKPLNIHSTQHLGCYTI